MGGETTSASGSKGWRREELEGKKRVRESKEKKNLIAELDRD